MGKLYDIVAELNAVLELEDSEDYADTIDAIKLEFEEKVDNIACFMKQIKADIAAIKAEENNLKARRIAKEHKLDRLNKYVKEAMQSVDIKKIETARNVISVRKNAESVVIMNDEELISWLQDCGFGDYVRCTESVPKENIKELINRGIDVPFVEKKRSESVVIK